MNVFQWVMSIRVVPPNSEELQQVTGGKSFKSYVELPGVMKRFFDRVINEKA